MRVLAKPVGDGQAEGLVVVEIGDWANVCWRRRARVEKRMVCKIIGLVAMLDGYEGVG